MRVIRQRGPARHVQGRRYIAPAQRPAATVHAADTIVKVVAIQLLLLLQVGAATTRAHQHAPLPLLHLRLRAERAGAAGWALLLPAADAHALLRLLRALPLAHHHAWAPARSQLLLLLLRAATLRS